MWTGRSRTSRSHRYSPVLPIQFQSCERLVGDARVDKEHDEVAPTLWSAVTSLAHANAASVSASDSLVNLADGAIPDPTAAVGVTNAHRDHGLGAIKAFDYMSGTTASGLRSV
jgi:hypothetical protein